MRPWWSQAHLALPFPSPALSALFAANKLENATRSQCDEIVHQRRQPASDVFPTFRPIRFIRCWSATRSRCVTVAHGPASVMLDAPCVRGLAGAAGPALLTSYLLSIRVLFKLDLDYDPLSRYNSPLCSTPGERDRLVAPYVGGWGTRSPGPFPPPYVAPI